MSKHQTSDLLKVLAQAANLPPELVDYLTSTHPAEAASSTSKTVKEQLHSKNLKNRMKNHRRQARKLGITLEEYEANLEAGSNQSQGKTKAKEKHRLEVARRIVAKAPKELTIHTYDSPHWKKLVEGVPEDILSLCTDVKGTSFNPYKQGKSTQDQQMFSEGSEPRTPLFEGMSPEEIKSRVLEMITDPDMVKVEEKFALKFGDFINQPFEEWVDNLFPFFTPVTMDVKRDTLEKAIREVFGEVTDAIENFNGDWWLRPLSIEDAYSKVPSDGNSGWPFFTSKWNRDPKKVEYYLTQAERLLNGSDELIGTPHILWTRVQNDGEKSKIRPVECPAKSEAIAARAMTDPLINVMKSMTQFSGFNGGDNVHRYIEPFMEKEWLYSLDYSKFDANCQGLMPVVIKFIKTLYDPTYHAYFDNLLEFYQHVSLITPAGVFEGKGINGLMSGEGWTSLIGTFANAISIKYTLLRLEEEGVITRRDEINVLSFGDDIALASNERLSLDLLATKMAEVGMVCNVDKQEETCGPDAHFSFLGYYYFKRRWLEGVPSDAMPVFPIMRLLPSLVFQERSLHVDKMKASVKKMTVDEETRASIMALLEDDQLDVYLMSTVMRLNNLRNHKDFANIVDFVNSNSHVEITSDKLLPFEKLATMFRGNRTSRNFGLAKSAIVQHLWVKEGKGNYQFIESLDKAEFQMIYSVVINEESMKTELRENNEVREENLNF